MAIPIKIQTSYFVDINKLILNFIWSDKRSRIANTILKKGNKVGGLTLPDFGIGKRLDKEINGPE